MLSYPNVRQHRRIRTAHSTAIQPLKSSSTTTPWAVHSHHARCQTGPVTPPLPLVLFDGHCGLCDRSVQFLLRWDRHGRLHFAPLQGPTAAAYAPTPDPNDPGTFVLVDEQGIHLRSDAALRTLAHLGPWWRGVLVLRLVPRPVRDAVYNWVARHRYQWFGRMDQCRVPTPGQAARFLP